MTKSVPSSQKEETPAERLLRFQQEYYPDKRELCWRAKISDSTWSRLTRGQFNLRADTLIALQVHAGCNISWYLVGEGDMLADNEVGNSLRNRENG